MVGIEDFLISTAFHIEVCAEIIASAKHAATSIDGRKRDRGDNRHNRKRPKG
jgi:hypothetical protein